MVETNLVSHGHIKACFHGWLVFKSRLRTHIIGSINGATVGSFFFLEGSRREEIIYSLIT